MLTFTNLHIEIEPWLMKITSGFWQIFALAWWNFSSKSSWMFIFDAHEKWFNLRSLGRAEKISWRHSADINHYCFCFVIIAKWHRKTNVFGYRKFPGDKADLKKLQAVPFHPKNSQYDLWRKNRFKRNMERWITNHCVDKRITY